MANEFIIKNGYFSQGNSNITGSLAVTGGVTASLQGTASNALTASNSLTASYVNPLRQDVIITGSLSVGSGSRALTTSINTGSNTFILNSSANLGLNAGPNAGIAFTVNNGATAAMYITSASQVLIGNPRVNPIESGSATLHVTNVGTPNSFLVEDSTNPDTTPFVIDNAGNVGIGTTAPNSKLEVNGNAIITGSLTVTSNITGSRLLITGSDSNSLVRITNTGTGAALAVVGVTTLGGDVGIGAGRVYIAASSSQQYAIEATQQKLNGYGGRLVGHNGGIFQGLGQADGTTTTTYGAYATAQDSITNIAVVGVADNGDGYVATTNIGASFTGANATNSYSVQLLDGTEGTGKVLVSQTSDGKANWSTKLSGSYEITGSLAVSGSVIGQSGNTISSDALVQASLLYLSNNF